MISLPPCWGVATHDIVEAPGLVKLIACLRGAAIGLANAVVAAWATSNEVAPPTTASRRNSRRETARAVMNASLFAVARSTIDLRRRGRDCCTLSATRQGPARGHPVGRRRRSARGSPHADELLEGVTTLRHLTAAASGRPGDFAHVEVPARIEAHAMRGEKRSRRTRF